ncbi:hypothetical protein V8G54_008708, partial [Vigna mungo]
MAGSTAAAVPSFSDGSGVLCSLLACGGEPGGETRRRGQTWFQWRLSSPARPLTVATEASPGGREEDPGAITFLEGNRRSRALLSTLKKGLGCVGCRRRRGGGAVA